MKARSFFAVVLLGLFLAASAQGQSPMINYQGKLTDIEGQPLDGTVSIQFSIYSQETGGTALWAETQSSLSVQNGIFNVLLGSVNPLPESLFDGHERWLGLRVGSDAEMSPRQQIVSVGYALRADKANEADDADMVDGQHASNFASATHDHDAAYVNEGQANSITGGMIVNGTVQEADLSFDVPDGHSLDAADGNPIDALYVNNDGKVGIGTTSPTDFLQIEGDPAWLTLSTKTLGSGSSCVRYKEAGSLKWTVGYSPNQNEFFFYNHPRNQTSLNIVDNTGNVGVGDLTPKAKLDVAGTIRATNYNEIGSGVGVELGYYTPGEFGYVVSYNRSVGNDYKELQLVGSSLKFMEATNEVMSIDGGKVGIGTTSPGAKLDIEAGTIELQPEGYSGQLVLKYKEISTSGSNYYSTGISSDKTKPNFGIILSILPCGDYGCTRKITDIWTIGQDEYDYNYYFDLSEVLDTHEPSPQCDNYPVRIVYLGKP